MRYSKARSGATALGASGNGEVVLIFGGGITTGGSPMVIWKLLVSERTGLGGDTTLTVFGPTDAFR